MKLIPYMKDRLLSIILFFSMCCLIVLLLTAFRVQLSLIFGVCGVLIVFSCLIFFLDFFRKKTFYTLFLSNLERLDKKYLILETLNNPNFYEGKIMKNALYEINKSMAEEIMKYKLNMDEIKEYIELWIHEVKLPLQTLTLMGHNHKEKLDQHMLQQIKKIDDYLEQILYYTRIENAEIDYLIKECSLEKIINQVALKNKNLLLDEKIQLVVSDVFISVLTDSKWLEFMLNQIMNNSIKYHDQKKSSYIKIMAQEEKEKILLTIYDNGIGISSSDLPKVFEKTFTGSNGRCGKNSTGMGLYIVKRLCSRLGHIVEIKSKRGEFTMVTISFFKDNHFTVIK